MKLNILVKQQHEMYWNEMRKYRMLSIWGVKQQHEMYWNYLPFKAVLSSSLVKQQHEMYWNGGKWSMEIEELKLNNNMRCIETLNTTCHLVKQIIVKQQHEMYWNTVCYYLYCNINIVKQQHEMYWNFPVSFAPACKAQR